MYEARGNALKAWYHINTTGDMWHYIESFPPYSYKDTKEACGIIWIEKYIRRIVIAEYFISLSASSCLGEQVVSYHNFWILMAVERV